MNNNAQTTNERHIKKKLRQNSEVTKKNVAARTKPRKKLSCDKFFGVGFCHF